jgi:hypothetical protein
MEHHLRLAQARGSLVAPNSPVQDLAIQILALLEAKEREVEKVDHIRRLLLDHSLVDVYRVFPEFVPADFAEQMAFAKAHQPDGTFDPELLDDSALSWRAEGIDKDEDDEITRWIKDREGQLSLSTTDLEGWK